MTPEQEIKRAAEYLDAAELPTGAWVYYAEEVGRYYVISAQDLLDLVDLLDDEDIDDGYSHWCAGCGREMPEGWQPDRCGEARPDRTG